MAVSKHTSKLFEEYSYLINNILQSNKDDAKKTIKEIVDTYLAIENPSKEDLDVFRKTVINEVDKRCYNSALMTARATEEFYDLATSTAYVMDYDALLAKTVDSGKVESYVRKELHDIFVGKQERFADKMGNYTWTRGRHTSYATMANKIQIAHKHGDKNIRYARVLAPKENCGFCVMLASRGFVYHTYETANAHVHANCGCSPMPGYPGQDIPFYDVDHLYDVYLDAKKSVVRGDKSSKQLSNAIAKEIESRDFEWVMSGKVPHADLERFDLTAAEKRGLRKFEKHGFSVVPQIKSNELNKKTASFLVNDKFTAEFVTSVGGGKNSIKNQFTELKGRSENLIIDLDKSPISLDKAIKESQKQLKDYKYHGIERVYLLNDGELLVVTK